jgi:hypothetical protein
MHEDSGPQQAFLPDPAHIQPVIPRLKNPVPRSRGTRKAARKLKTYGRIRSVPASSVGQLGTRWAITATLPDFQRVLNAARVPTWRGLC